MILGFIGLGLMGESMALNLVKKSGETVIVFDIAEEKVNHLVHNGALGGKSDVDVVQKADIIFTSVPKSEHVESIYKNVKGVIKEDQIFIEMSTIDPETTTKLAEEIALLGAHMLDCPLVKSKKDAIAGTLGIYVGGDKKIFEKVKKYLYCIGSEILYMGASGTGISMKICHNMLLGEIQNGVNEMLTLADKINIDVETFKMAVNMGGAKNAYLDAKAESIKNRDFTTAFSVANMNKDVHIAKKLASSHNLVLPGVELVNHLYDQAMADELANLDLSATITVVEKSAKKS